MNGYLTLVRSGKCADCPAIQISSESISKNGFPCAVTLFCENRFLCDSLEEYLRGELKKEAEHGPV